MKSIVKRFQDLPIRLKMFYVYSFMAFVMVVLVGVVVYYQVSQTIERNIENELSNATAAILNMVKTTAKASIKNYLRAVAEKKPGHCGRLLCRGSGRGNDRGQGQKSPQADSFQPDHR